MMTTQASIPLLAGALLLSACTAVGTVAYDVSLQDQAKRCQALQDYSASRECIAKVDAQARQAKAVRDERSAGGAAEGLSKPSKSSDLCFMRAGERVCPN